MKTKFLLSNFLFAILMNINITGNAQAPEQGFLLVCAAPGGLSATAITNSSATVRWLPVSRFAKYNVQYKLSTALNWTTAADSTTSTSVNIFGLSGSTLYDWRIRTKCSGSYSIYSQSQFTTLAFVCAIPNGFPASVVTSTSATVSWSSVPGATSYSLYYQGAGAATGIIINGITDTSYNLTGLTAGITYNFQVKTVCVSGSSGYSSMVSFATPTSSGNFYCTSLGNTTYEYINKIVIGSINKTSGNNNGYGDFTGLSTSLTAGTSYTITLTPGFTSSAYKEYWTVFIDYNQDGILNEAGEIVATGSGTGQVSRTFTVPATAKNGSARLRIVMQYASYRNNPCGTFIKGEVEDYTVNISGGTGFAAIAAAPPDNVIAVNKVMNISIAPNPVAGSDALITYNLTHNGKTFLQLINADGRNIRFIQLGNLSAGAHNYTLTELNQLSSGIYVLQLNQYGGAAIRKRFVVIR